MKKKSIVKFKIMIVWRIAMTTPCLFNLLFNRISMISTPFLHYNAKSFRTQNILKILITFLKDLICKNVEFVKALHASGYLDITDF